MKLTKEDTIDKVGYRLISDQDIADGKQAIEINVMRNIEITKAGDKTLEANGRRHNQEDIGLVTTVGTWRNVRVIFVKSGTDLEPYIETAKKEIREHIKNRQEYLENTLAGANELAENLEESFSLISDKNDYQM